MNRCASFFRRCRFKDTIVDEYSVIATRSYWFDETNPGKSSQITVYQGDRHFSSLLTAAVTWRVKLYFRWKSCDLTRSRKSFLPPSPPPLQLPDSHHKTCGALWYAKLTRIGHTPLSYQTYLCENTPSDILSVLFIFTPCSLYPIGKWWKGPADCEITEAKTCGQCEKILSWEANTNWYTDNFTGTLL